MERGPIINVLTDMIGTSTELDLMLNANDTPLELRDVVEVQPLHSSHGIRITTKANTIWIDASHVSAMWQARVDIG